MSKTTRRAPVSINIVPVGEGAPANKLADAELLFHDGPLAGLKLTGFAVWSRQGRRPQRHRPDPALHGQRREEVVRAPPPGRRRQRHR